MPNEITGTTQLTALLGSPVAHSISPQMHNEAFRLLNLDYRYLAFEVSPSDLKDVVKGLKAIHIRGFNLTMPHKTAIIEYMDTLTPAARLANSVNTVILEDGKFIGHTTDGIGYMHSVKDAGYDITGKQMTLLGAGGAATAICVQAALDGVSTINIFKRKNASFAKVTAFADQLTRETNCTVQVLDFADKKSLKDSIYRSTILTNATNVGMEPDTDSSMITDPSFFHKDLIVSDIIYHPRQTRFLQLASQAGCHTFNGMYMLLFQGAASFQCWTGKEMPVDIIKEKYFL